MARQHKRGTSSGVQKQRSTNKEVTRRRRKLQQLALECRQTASVAIDVRAPPAGAASRATEDYGFFKALKRSATPAVNTNHVKVKLHELIKEATPAGFCLDFDEYWSSIPEPDTRFIDTSSGLRRALEQPFTTIFIPHRATMSNVRSWSFEKQVEAMEGTVMGQAYQPARPPAEGDVTTHDVSFGDLKRWFLHNNGRKGVRGIREPEEFGTNVLDSRSVAPHEFIPAEFKESSLEHRIQRLTAKHARSWGRSASGLAEARLPNTEWCIMSTPNAVSSTHCDIMGMVTWIVIVEGSKLWYNVKGDQDTARSELFSHGSHYTNYGAGMYMNILQPGDCFVQGPGVPHAVATPERCYTLLAGCFGYTAGTLHLSIRCIRLTMENKMLCNEDILPHHWDRVTILVKNFDLPDLLTRSQTALVETEVFELLLSQERITPSEMEDRYIVTGRPSTLQKAKTPLEKAEERFLKACEVWWNKSWQISNEGMDDDYDSDAEVDDSEQEDDTSEGDIAETESEGAAGEEEGDLFS